MSSSLSTSKTGNDATPSHSEKGEEKGASEATAESHANLQDFPEGGWAGWATAIGACVCAYLYCDHGHERVLEQISRSVLHLWVSYSESPTKGLRSGRFSLTTDGFV